MKATKIAPLVLMCIVALACVTSISLALLPNLTLRMESKTTHDTPKLATMTHLIHPMGDPIDDPKPNKH